jgi:purine nucleoside phosphorylase
LQLIPGLEGLDRTDGHKRRISYGKLDGVPVLTLEGRAHLHECPYDAEHLKRLRLHIDLLPHLGAKTVILTCTAGDLARRFDLGDIAVINDFVQMAVPIMPLWSGDRKCFPEDVFTKDLRDIALRDAEEREGRRSAKEAVYAMMHGPHFEGIPDKTALERMGAHVVGMSLLPEACIIGLYPEVRALGLALITNDKRREAYVNHKTKEQRFEEDQKRVQDVAKTLGPYLSRIVAHVAPPPSS